MSVRLRRLQADYEKICTVFTGKSKIRLIKTVGNPPEKYQFEFMVSGLEKDHVSGDIRSRNNFHIEIVLTSSYPRMAPQCKMLTPVFHPNIAPHAICIGDHWSAGESLPNLIIRIGEMLAYQSYNVKSPLNGDAAKWTEQNMDKFPTDTFDFSSILSLGEVATRQQEISGDGVCCANCGTAHEPGSPPFKGCINNHITCPDCEIVCEHCGSLMCLKCALFKCNVCGKTVCHNCIHKCRGCKRLVCVEDRTACGTCGHMFCNDCIVQCENCASPTCINDVISAETVDGGKVYLCAACRDELQQNANKDA